MNRERPSRQGDSEGQGTPPQLRVSAEMINTHNAHQVAVAKARELGVTENVAILDDGGNLKAFSRMDGASIPTIEIAQNKAYTALFSVSTQDFFNFIQGDPSLLAGIPTLARVAAWGGGFPIEVNGEVVGAIGLSGAPTVQNDVDCARAALALVSDASRRAGRSRGAVSSATRREGRAAPCENRRWIWSTCPSRPRNSGWPD
jgi:uncharacterized protein GlcG (DUF336 family)